MSPLEEAVTLDCDRVVIEAADAYESVLASAAVVADEAANLMVLYWQSTDYGFSSAHALPQQFVATAGDRLEEFLTIEYSPDDEPTLFFWKRYIGWIEFGEPFSIEESQELMSMHPDYIEPAFHVYSFSSGKLFGELAKSLLASCSESPTVRASYVASVIKGTMEPVG